ALNSAPDRVEEVTIIGVAGGIMKRADTESAILYYATPLEPLLARMLYVRIDETGRFSAAALHAAVREIDARVPVNTTETLADDRAERHTERKMLAQGAAGLGLLAPCASILRSVCRSARCWRRARPGSDCSRSCSLPVAS